MLIWLFALLFFAQDNPPQACKLSGTVVNSVTGAPLGKVEVYAERVDRYAPPALHGTLGRFNYRDNRSLSLASSAGEFRGRVVEHTGGLVQAFGAAGIRRHHQPDESASGVSGDGAGWAARASIDRIRV